MTKNPARSREDEVLLRMLKTPPQPHADMKGKDKASPKPSANKARAIEKNHERKLKPPSP